MPGESTKAFKDQFTARIAYARHKAGYTQATMAEALGFGPPEDPSAQGKYHKYEKRSFMPHPLIARFCDLCDITTGWLYSGPAVARPVENRGRKPKPPPSPRQRQRKGA
jgi:transcriptional regulator with XRE-family HTH domain